METAQSPTKYVIYARKSLESEDRQVQSIEDQLTRLREIAVQRSLTVVETLIEARSAKSPGTRPVFDRLLSLIEGGQVQGILCWQVNRLSRNPIDSGKLSWLLQRSVLLSIQTTEREYRPEDNVLLLSVEAGMANQYILDLSRNVKRGILGKLSRGELPGRAPIGYLNERLTKVVVKDPQRFALVRKAWDLMLTGTFSVADVRRRAYSELSLRHVAKRSSISLSMMHRLFNNPFYAGLIRVNGRLYPGKHETMISMDEYERVQQLIHRSNRPRASVHRFTYSRLLRCAECGCMVTAEHKTKHIKATGGLRTYTYYHCTGKRALAECKQRAHVREELLTASIAAELTGVTILAEFRNYALAEIRKCLHQKNGQRANRTEEGRKERAVVERRRDRLLDLCVRGVISEAELGNHRRSIENELQVLNIKNVVEDREALKARRVEEAFNLLARIDQRFLQGTPEERRVIVAGVGSNWTLRDGKPLVSLKRWCVRIAELSRRAAAAFRGLEPAQSPDKSIRNSPFGLSDVNWQSVVDEVGNQILAEDEALQEVCLCFRCYKRKSHRCPEECPPQKAA